MDETVALPSPGVDPAVPARPASQASAPPVRRAPIGPGESDVRLVIQKSGDTGRYVYTVLDRESGRVITRIPSADVLRLMQAETYAAGALVQTRA